MFIFYDSFNTIIISQGDIKIHTEETWMKHRKKLLITG